MTFLFYFILFYYTIAEAKYTRNFIFSPWSCNFSQMCSLVQFRFINELKVVFQNQCLRHISKSLSQNFSLTVPIWWNDLPNSIRAAESLPIFKKRLKTHLFHLYLTL